MQRYRPHANFVHGQSFLYFTIADHESAACPALRPRIALRHSSAVGMALRRLHNVTSVQQCRSRQFPLYLSRGIITVWIRSKANFIFSRRKSTGSMRALHAGCSCDIQRWRTMAHAMSCKSLHPYRSWGKVQSQPLGKSCRKLPVCCTDKQRHGKDCHSL